MPVHPLVQEALERPVILPHRLGKRRDRAPQRADVVGRFDPRIGEARAGLGDHVAHHPVDHSAHRFVDQARLVEAGVALRHLMEHRTDQRHVGEIGDREEAGAQPVVDVVVVVGDVVGERGDLRLGPRIGVDAQIMARIVFGDRRRQRRVERAVVLDGALERLPGQVEPVELGIAVFEPGQDAQGLVVVREAAKGRHLGVERLLAGMAERGVAEVMREADRLGQILVEAQRAAGVAGDLRHFQAVGQPGAVMVALVIDEDLGLVLQAAERGRMDDAVAVALKRRAHVVLRLGVEPAAALLRLAPRKARARPATLTALKKTLIPRRRPVRDAAVRRLLKVRAPSRRTHSGHPALKLR